MGKVTFVHDSSFDRLQILMTDIRTSGVKRSVQKHFLYDGLERSINPIQNAIAKKRPIHRFDLENSRFIVYFSSETRCGQLLQKIADIIRRLIGWMFNWPTPEQKLCQATTLLVSAAFEFDKAPNLPEPSYMPGQQHGPPRTNEFWERQIHESNLYISLQYLIHQVKKDPQCKKEIEEELQKFPLIAKKIEQAQWVSTH